MARRHEKLGVAAAEGHGTGVGTAATLQHRSRSDENMADRSIFPPGPQCVFRWHITPPGLPCNYAGWVTNQAAGLSRLDWYLPLLSVVTGT